MRLCIRLTAHCSVFLVIFISFFYEHFHLQAVLYLRLRHALLCVVVCALREKVNEFIHAHFPLIYE